tara:strand:- start:539 stop:1711 length:1173 start_codon:yes stop_codon:yes gene_type:complete
MKKIEEVSDLNDKKVILRLDLNVPLNGSEITDPTRIEKILPTLRFLIHKNSKIIIISHIGRPRGKVVKNLSMLPVCKYISKKLNKEVELIEKKIFDIDINTIFKNSKSKILFLENIRFYEQEEENSEEFAKLLSTFGDIYINDAFSCSHRAHASIDKITKFIPAYCGMQMNNEVNALKKLTSDIKRPITCIIGGSKISTKINLIKNLIPKFENIVIVGGMANNILKYKGYNIGNSIRETNCDEVVSKIFSLAEKNNCNLVFPSDVAIGKKLDDKAEIKDLNKLQDDDIILDIGPKTINLISFILENSKTVLWNGPAGYFENPNFAVGSKKIANKIIELENNLFSVAGGGDTIAVLNEENAFKKFNFVSTAGGAFLEYLEGKEIPGIRALN